MKTPIDSDKRGEKRQSFVQDIIDEKRRRRRRKKRHSYLDCHYIILSYRCLAFKIFVTPDRGL